MKNAIATFMLLGFACVPPIDTKRETCGNGIDDDGNGKTDCFDPDCQGQPACVSVLADSGMMENYGTCAKCGNACVNQNECIEVSYINDRPLPVCSGQKCKSQEYRLQVKVVLDTAGTWGGFSTAPKSATTRFIKKTSINGSAVTCATLEAIAVDKTKPLALEQNATLLIQGLDCTRLTNPALGQKIPMNFVNTQTGSDYLVWSEFWAGPPDSSTQMPTANRLGHGCFESATVLGGALVPDDNCPSAVNMTGSCRTFELKMPGPE